MIHTLIRNYGLDLTGKLNKKKELMSTISIVFCVNIKILYQFLFLTEDTESTNSKEDRKFKIQRVLIAEKTENLNTKKKKKKQFRIL